MLLFCAEQKMVPDVPMRKLSRTLSGAAGADAAAPNDASAAAMAMADLPISNLRSVRSASADHDVAAARHRIVDLVVEVHRRGVDQLERWIRCRCIFAVGVALVVVAILVVAADAAQELRKSNEKASVSHPPQPDRTAVHFGVRREACRARQLDAAKEVLIDDDWPLDSVWRPKAMTVTESIRCWSATVRRHRWSIPAKRSAVPLFWTKKSVTSAVTPPARTSVGVVGTCMGRERGIAPCEGLIRCKLIEQRAFTDPDVVGLKVERARQVTRGIRHHDAAGVGIDENLVTRLDGDLVGRCSVRETNVAKNRDGAVRLKQDRLRRAAALAGAALQVRIVNEDVGNCAVAPSHCVKFNGFGMDIAILRQHILAFRGFRPIAKDDRLVANRVQDQQLGILRTRRAMRLR